MSVNVLIVDDSKVERMYLAGLLERLGAVPDITENCDEAVLRACEEQYDIMFIDYFMPDSDGVHTLKEIRRNEQSINKETPAVALGTADKNFGEDFFITEGFTNYIEKPVNNALLHAALILYLPEEKRNELGRTAEAEEEKTEEAAAGLSWLDEVDEISVEDGIKNCGSEEGFVSALEIFYDSIGAMSDEIEGYYKNEDWKNYTIKVHALKSSARIIGAADLSELAKQLEAAGDGGDLDFIHKETEHLLSWHRSFRDKLKHLGGEEEKEDESEKPLAERDFLEDAFSSLVEFAAQMDYDLVEMVIEQFSEYRLEPKDKEYFDKVNTAFAALDWNAIGSAAESYIEELYKDSGGEEMSDTGSAEEGVPREPEDTSADKSAEEDSTVSAEEIPPEDETEKQSHVLIDWKGIGIEANRFIEEHYKNAGNSPGSEDSG